MDSTSRLLKYLRDGSGRARQPGDPAPPPQSFDGADLNTVASPDALRNGTTIRWEETNRRVWIAFADLRGCSLKTANLANVCFESADFTKADLVNASLAGCRLGGAKFDYALLEEANLCSAHLRFATFRGAVLEGARANDADFRGAVLEGADLDRADFRGADLEEADLRKVEGKGADFRGAKCGLTDFRDADLRGADFRDAILRDAKFDRADLRGANLQDADLTGCKIAGIRLSGARLDRTRMRQDQLGEAIGEELAGEYELARQGYLLLERNFADLGDPEAASWAYRRRRRVQKWESLRRARQAVSARQWRCAVRPMARYASDWVVQLVCDYGESMPRVLLTIVAVILMSTLWYGFSGGVLKDAADASAPREVCRSPVDLLRYSMTVMVSPSDSPPDLQAATEADQFITLVQSYVGIFLIGLLGFVAGNRIRR